MKNLRRDFLKAFAATAAGLPLSHILNAQPVSSDEGFVLNEDEQKTFLIGPRRAPVTFMVNRKDASTSSSLCREEIVPGDGIPVHKHLNEDELIYIQYGTGVFLLGEKQFEVKAGSSAYVPKGVWHGIKNTGTDDLRMVFSFTPSGFENYFREIGVPKGSPDLDVSKLDWEAIDEKYGIVYRR